ncbi:MAG: hypothetical protein LC115_08285 [Bacteroidia bacterium]|nr:hypothetical protein [Bacteroidia bacterium]
MLNIKQEKNYIVLTGSDFQVSELLLYSPNLPGKFLAVKIGLFEGLDFTTISLDRFAVYRVSVAGKLPFFIAILASGWEIVSETEAQLLIEMSEPTIIPAEYRDPLSVEIVEPRDADERERELLIKLAETFRKESSIPAGDEK